MSDRPEAPATLTMEQVREFRRQNQRMFMPPEDRAFLDAVHEISSELPTLGAALLKAMTERQHPGPLDGEK